MGCDFSNDGTTLWRRSAPDVKLTLRPIASANSWRPAATRETTLSALRSLSLEHAKDRWASGAGRRADRDAADAALQTTTHSLERVVSDPIDKFTTRLGTGWGHRPKPRAQRCVMEIGQLEKLVMGVQEHAACCGPFTELIDASDGAYWSCHSVGVASTFRNVPLGFCCAHGHCFSWSSAAPLPGGPAKVNSTSATPATIRCTSCTRRVCRARHKLCRRFRRAC
jgi:hypothetical protein